MDYRLERYNNNSCRVIINGHIDYEAAKELKNVFDSLLGEGVNEIILNLANVPVSNSTGIGTILMLYKSLKKRGGNLSIRGIHPNLYSMLKLVKIDSIIDIKEDA